ncbi:MAG: mechanosensitive ion channel [Gammaproteobacteria bacterium]|nr:mechanosensitive ion channel [Gammaproteobacteria bacterium]
MSISVTSCNGVATAARRTFALAVFLVGQLLVTWPAFAQQTQPAPAAMTELEVLVSTLEDAEQRAALVRQLQALIEVQRAGETVRERAPNAAGARVLAALSGRIEAVSSFFLAAIGGVTELPTAISRAAAQIRDEQTRSHWLAMILKVASVLAAAVIAEWLARLLFRRTQRTLESAERDAWLARALLLLARAVLDLACIGAFALAAYGLLSIVEPREATQLIVIALINASVAARTIVVAMRVLLSPQAPGLRLWPVGDETANYWALWIRRFANIGVYGFFAIETALLLGLAPELHTLLINLLGLVLTVMLIVLIRQLREDVADVIRAGREAGGTARLRQRLADLWHVAAMLYVIAGYAVWAMEVEGGFRYLATATLLSLLVLGIAKALLTLAARLIDRVFTVSEELAAHYPGLEARANRYISMLHRAARVIIYLVAALAVAQAWEIDTLAWFGTDTGRAVLGKLVTVTVIVVGSLIVWEVAGTVIEAYVRRAEQTDARGARLRTLLPLARKVLLVVLVVMSTLTALSEIGIDIAPLLAGAGVVGLAIGFGAQTLVKDVITGVFILVEDSIKVGDVVEASGHTGVVETLSIRTISLRDVEGIVHVVPFSDVTSVLNYTKDYSRSLLDIGVAYRENVDDVIEVLKQVGAEMQSDETHGPNILEPLEVLGLNSLDDSAVTIRARFKTMPGTQWATRREFLRRIKQRFDELGIEIPFPHQTVWFGVDKEGKAPAAPVRLEGKA